MGRDWRKLAITGPRKKMLQKLREGNEWHALELSEATGVAYATVYQSLRAFEDARWVTSRLEGAREHQARETPGSRAKRGPRRTYWRITGLGMQQSAGL